MQIIRIDALPLILNTGKADRAQLVLVEAKLGAMEGEAPRVVVTVGSQHIEQTFTLPESSRTAVTLVRVPYVSTRREALLAVKHGEKLLAQQKFTIEPVPDFRFYLFPSSHMCVAYENTMFLAHHDAAYAVEQAIRMLEKYPEGVWSVEYAWGLKLYWDKHPEQRALIRRLVQEGRLEVGGRFSPNIQDGLDEESLARQIAQTQWWMEETFGKRAEVAFDWDCPVFYPQEAQLYRQGGLAGWVDAVYQDFDEDRSRPQTARRQGSPFFRYTAPDGSAVVALAPAQGLHDHYANSGVVGYDTFRRGGGLLRTLDPKAITVDYARKLTELVRKARQLSGMDFLAGSADVGDQSGPKEELFQRVRTWNATFANPKIEFLSAAQCLKKAQASGKVTDRLEGDIPFWIRHAQGNMLVLRWRANEVSADLRFAETLAALDFLALGSMYPREALTAAWTELLQAQQHEQYETIVCPGDDVLDWGNAKLNRAEAIARLAADLAMRDLASRIAYAPHGRPVAVFNRLNWESRDVVSVTVPRGEENLTVLDSAGQAVPATAREIAGGREVSFVATAPPLGYSSYYLAPAEARKAQTHPRNTIENEFYRLTVNEKTGVITSLFDRTLGRELVDSARPAGGLKLVWDDGGPKRSWSLSRPSGKVWRQTDYPNSTVTSEASPLGQELVVRGPLLGEGEAQFGQWREVRYRLAAGIPRLDIAIRYAWGPDPKKTKRAWLMFDLPLALSNTRATYGSPYAAVDYQEFSGDQPTLRRIRTMHNWCDLYDSSAGIGVTVAGPSTQVELRPDGLAIALISRHGNVPGERCIGLDGEHAFHYALHAHRGDWRESHAVRFGAEHEAGRSPLRAVLASSRGGKMPARQTLLPVKGEHLVVTALKQTHEGEDLVLRLYESQGKPSEVGLREAQERGIVKAWKSNILEEGLEPVEPAALARVPVAPWEILSLRMKLAPRGGEVADWKK